jgi:hypothetical protein
LARPHDRGKIAKQLTERANPKPQEAMMKISSPAFGNGEKIPSKYTCDGQNISPPLEISQVPAGARSLVLIMEDPDVPKNLRKDGMWDHWKETRNDPLLNDPSPAVDGSVAPRGSQNTAFTPFIRSRCGNSFR